jgi:hypothetical protein
MLAPGPFRAEHIRSGDPYELSNGHAIFTPPTGRRGGRANAVGTEVLDTDPKVEAAAVDLGVSMRPQELRAPDIAVGAIPDEPGWAKTAPPLAVEYADEGQNEEELHVKIGELLAAGTRFVWVVRLAGERCVEVYEPRKPVRVVRPGSELRAPGVLANPVLVEALYDREVAHEHTLRNLLNRKGFRDLDDVERKGREQGREQGREEGRDEGRVDALRAAVGDVLSARGIALTKAESAMLKDEADAGTLARWLTVAATATSAADVFKRSRKRR